MLFQRPCHKWLILFRRRFPEGFLSVFHRNIIRKGWRSGPQSRCKILPKTLLLPLGIILGDVGTFWYQFGTLLERFGVTFDDLFLPFDGIIERQDLAYFGIFVQPFFIILYGLNLGTILPSKLLNIPSNGFVFLESSVVCHRSAKQPTTNNKQPTAFNQQASNNE